MDLFKLLKPSNNAPGILTGTHGTPFSRSIYGRTKWEIKQKTILTYSPDLAPSNEYLEVIIQSLELKLYNEKVEVLLDYLFYRIQPLLSH